MKGVSVVTLDNSLNGHQKMMLELLQQFHGICAKHEIRYMLFAGSALGAVRHQGFIPWDDDLDVIMLRRDYERFMEIAPKELGDAYYLQREYSPHWPMFFSKLRKNGTTCIERFIPKDPLLHQGVYIDIFPCDNLSDFKLLRPVQFLASKIVIAKGLDARGYLTDSPLKKLFMKLCHIVPLRAARAIAMQRGRENTEMVHCFFAAASRYKRSVFPRVWMEEAVPLLFEGQYFPVSKHCKELLTTLYGADYMIPTPVEQRGQKVHAELIDLENSYEKYAGIQKTMKFNEYSRSIR